MEIIPILCKGMKDESFRISIQRTNIIWFEWKLIDLIGRWSCFFLQEPTSVFLAVIMIIFRLFRKFRYFNNKG